jgi:hypothetical protein
MHALYTHTLENGTVMLVWLPCAEWAAVRGRKVQRLRPRDVLVAGVCATRLPDGRL